MIRNPYIINCPPDDVQRMIVLYEQKVAEETEALNHLRWLAELDAEGVQR